MVVCHSVTVLAKDSLTLSPVTYTKHGALRTLKGPPWEDPRIAPVNHPLWAVRTAIKRQSAEGMAWGEGIGQVFTVATAQPIR